METTSEYSSAAKAHSINTKALLLGAGGCAQVIVQYAFEGEGHCANVA